MAIETSGRPPKDGYNNWVREYKVQYTTDGVTWQWADSQRVFVGNKDGATPVLNRIAKPFPALAVRICPTDWETHISMKAEVWVKAKECGGKGKGKGKGKNHEP